MWVYILNFFLILLYNQILKNKQVFIVLVSIQLFLLLALRDPLLGVDNVTYMAGYEYISKLSFNDMLSRLNFIKTANLTYPYSFESGYVFLNWIIAFLGFDFHGFLVLHAGFCVFAVSKFIYENSSNYCLSFILFITLGFLTHQFGILRQTLALAIFLLSISFIKKRKPIKYLLLCLISFMIHRVALITIPLYYVCNIKLTKKKYIWMLFLLSGLLAMSPLLINLVSSFLKNVVGKDLQIQAMKLNSLFLIMILCAIMIAIFSSFQKLIGNRFDNNIFLWCFLWSIAIEIIGLYNDLIARAIYIPYIAIVVLLPNIMEEYPKKYIANIGKFMIIIMVFVFMILQLKDDFINPYIFYFE